MESPLPNEYNRIWDEIGAAVSSTSTMVCTEERPGEGSKKEDICNSSGSAAYGGGPATQELLTEIEIRALSLVGDSNRATTGIGADPLTQDDSDNSDHTNTERPDDRPTASTSGDTQPSPDFTPGRDEEEEEEEPLILEPVEVEVGVEMEEDTPAPWGELEHPPPPSLYSGDSPMAPLILRDQVVRSKVSPVLQCLCRSDGGWCRKGWLLHDR
uniref:uncharacterized protein n=1 Tax=Pristiophorus japonicus TaxID=55135 RepID=UPI00398EF85C